MESRKKKRLAQIRSKRRKLFLLILIIVFVGGFLVKTAVEHGIIGQGEYWEKEDLQISAEKPEMDVQLLTVNEYSRPGIQTGRIKNIVIHYTANAGSTAQENRDYFESLKDTKLTQASSNFIVGLEGEIIQCVPTWEVAYASNERNNDTVSIECCHLDETGEFQEETYRSLVQLTAWLCLKFDLQETDVIRHYDITGKLCPKYFVEREDAWEKFRKDVKEAMESQ